MAAPFSPDGFYSEGLQMRVVLFLNFFLASLFIPAVQAQVAPDTLTGEDLAEVQIIGQHHPRYTLGSRETHLDSAYLQINNANSLAEVLQSRTPVYLKTYGNGMLSTISFRGTSASQTAVLWNGFNINLPTLGQTDFSLIPLTAVQGVQLQHGSGGANFGTSAIGGAVILSSRTNWQPGWQLQAQQDAGSFDSYFSQLAGKYSTKKVSLETSFFRREAQNNFKFKNTTQFGAPVQRQENAALHQSGFTTNLSWRINARNTLAIRNWYTDNDNQSQSNMVAANTHAQLANRNWRLMSEWNHHSNVGLTAIRAAYFADYMLYRDDNTNSETQVNTYQIQGEQNFILAKKINVDAGGELQYFTADVDGYGKKVNETRASGFLLFRYDPLNFLHLNLNLRQAFVTGFNPPLAPTTGFTLDVFSRNHYTLGWKGSVSRGYRVPTLNDRYWPTGNAALKPENSYNYETGLTYKYTRGIFTAESEVTAYRMPVENWIQWLPSASTGVWSPQNLKKVLATGAEVSGKASWLLSTGKISTGFNYSYTSSKQQESYTSSTEPTGKQLIYVPYHTATAYADLTYKLWLLTANYQLTGQRFTTAENTRTLPAYGLFTLYGGKTIRYHKARFQIMGRVNNLTNKVYQNLEYYAMPGRHYNLSLRFFLH
ncbi:TonB-dependent receptor plug domain-containing protein [Adhaeribacter pallidiroseus]|uniref:Vitamin B12 transporter BtuB n=1 Tax=Adhaeribacter pallidiroseus TaxID=2072847 RepID=A0A369QS10_9BACT|nr:TonB-dependent receptor [Adhaeribacter pallidiroseus]RDC64968.1 Vitamin B12 transporter BtuB [Adhaeribacter pallidiroseus]